MTKKQLQTIATAVTTGSMQGIQDLSIAPIVPPESVMADAIRGAWRDAHSHAAEVAQIMREIAQGSAPLSPAGIALIEWAHVGDHLAGKLWPHLPQWGGGTSLAKS